MGEKKVSFRFYLAQCHKLQRGMKQFENRGKGRTREKKERRREEVKKRKLGKDRGRREVWR